MSPVFHQLVESLLDRAVACGLKPPIIFVMVSTNGYVSAVRYRRLQDGNWDATLLTEGKEPSGVFPVNLCFFDATGKLLSALVDAPEADPKWLQ